ncbi:hypothetical protein J5N97_017978 [Dioscorea zingiberensis]|uniref:Nodulation signaling pathway 2-like protein n=1 Tax=Dioscorea zingiberensis TaxID=325984 RepID=A0A9D5CP74_9LILI|nr:hypothetical protein J5N97_017978 [Dioscorea zingiberensis]
MEVMIEEGGAYFSGCSSTTTTTTLNDDDLAGEWADWASIVDWGTLANPADDFHSLIDSMLCDYNDITAGNSTAATGSISSTTTSCPSSPRSDEEDDVKGLRLVHLLMAAAEAMAAPAKDGRELARVILVRLKELLPVNGGGGGGGGSTMERLAVHFTDALLGLLDGGARHRDNHHHHHHHSNHDVIAAFQLLQDMSPYVKFGHFTANQAILEAVAGDRRVHIVDYDIMEGIQWASLMQALASRKDGPPAPHLRITAVTRSGAGGAKRPMSSVQETGRRLAAFAASIGQPFSFSHCRLDSDEKFRPAGVKVVKGEALVVNCMLHVPHTPERSPASVASFLAGAASLRPRLVTLVEEEEEEEEGGGFMGRFMAALHRYSAVCDSLEAGFPMHGRARGLVERVFLGPRIAGAVGRAFKGKDEDGGGGGGGWAERMAAMGFSGVGISFFNQCQARLLLGLFHDGYRVEETAANKLVLGWKSRRLLSASVWLAPATAGSPAASCGVKEGGDDGEEFDVLMMQSSPSI